MMPALLAGGQIAGLIGGVLDRVLPKKLSEQERLQLELELSKLDWQQALAQIETNKAEAAHESIFVAGWRPFVGWVCAGSLCWGTVVGPMLSWLLRLNGADVPPLPELPDDLTLPLLSGLLGLGGMRTLEKIRGVNTRR